ncbi:MAG: xylulokinase [Bacteroidaceae bacterium]|jgi:xylulokinase
MYTLGYDIGSSSIKASLLEVESGKVVASAFSPAVEMPIISRAKGWAEQHPDDWWCNLKEATRRLFSSITVSPSAVSAIGIAYQMHGLVCLDEAGRPLRPAIIWCDSRAVDIGRKAFAEIGSQICLEHSLNSPGNFTASKLKWVRDNEPALYKRIRTVMLPGDYIAYRLTGEAHTTLGGLSEAMLWDFKEGQIARYLLDYYGFEPSLFPSLCPTFGVQGQLTSAVAAELQLPAGIPVAYRAGDQPNNAFSLNVLRPGEIASTAGTSGVVYGVSDTLRSDPQGRIGTFAHVNHSADAPRLGLLLCINGTGCLNAFMRKTVATPDMNYDAMNALAAQAPIGSRGLIVLPFGNGAERMLCDRDLGCRILSLRFALHDRSCLLRAAQEGIAFAFCRGISLMRQMGMPVKSLHAGRANLFLSPLFCEALANVAQADIQLYDTDGAAGAARGAAWGAGYYTTSEQAFATLCRQQLIHPQPQFQAPYAEAYEAWSQALDQALAQEDK